jgi:hypothetical protein
VTATLLAALLVGGVWTTKKQMALQQRLDSTINQLVETVRQRDELQQQLKKTQPATDDLRKQVHALEETVVRRKSGQAPPTLIAVNLIPNLTRTASNVPAVAITSSTRFVQFSLLLLDDNYPSYRVLLRDADGKELWNEDGLSSIVTSDGKAIVVLVPVSLLRPADYTLSLSGISTPQAPENIGTFLFRIVRGRS